MAGTITLSGMSAGEPAGQRIFGPITMVGKAVIGETLVIPLVAGDNTIAVPVEAVAVVIIPPANNSTAIEFRTSENSTDDGLLINPGAFPFLYSFPSAIPTSLIINAATEVSAGTTIFFI